MLDACIQPSRPPSRGGGGARGSAREGTSGAPGPPRKLAPETGTRNSPAVSRGARTVLSMTKEGAGSGREVDVVVSRRREAFAVIPRRTGSLKRGRVELACAGSRLRLGRTGLGCGSRESARTKSVLAGESAFPVEGLFSHEKADSSINLRFLQNAASLR